MEMRAESHTGVQFLSYLAISSLAAGVNLVVGFSLYGLAGLSAGGLYAVSVAAGYSTGMLVNWSLNRLITFPSSGRRRLEEIRTFFTVAMLGLLLTVLLAALFRSTVAASMANVIARVGQISAPSTEAVGQIMAVGFVAMYSFLGHKYFTFARGVRFQVELLSGHLVEKLRGGKGDPTVNSSAGPAILRDRSNEKLQDDAAT